MSAPDPVLSARRRQVLWLLSKGRNRAQIAAELGLSTRTVDRHIENGRRQLQATTTAHAVRICFERRIFQLPEVRVP